MNKFVYDSWIEVICGPMFSGKTDKLLSRLDKIKYAKENYIVFKPIIDTRSVGCLVSRTKKIEKAIEINTAQDILDYLSTQSTNYKVIAIDEVQFLDKDIINICLKLSKQGHHVIVSGLDKNFKGEPFGVSMPGLLAIADKVTKLSACCHICGAKASFSQLIPSSFKSPTSGNILIGDKDVYEARCYEHFDYSDDS